MSMVTFILKEENERYIVFLYFPNGDKSINPGVIIYDKEKQRIEVTELAEDDWERDITPEELNEMADAINEIKRQYGDTDYAEYTTESEHSIYFGDHAITEILKSLDKGEVPQKGMQIWY